MVGVADAVVVRLVIDAPKEECLVTDGKLVESMERRTHDDVTFDKVAGATHVRDGRAVTERAGTLAHVIECVEGKVKKFLLLGNLALVRHSQPLLNSRNREVQS